MTDRQYLLSEAFSSRDFVLKEYNKEILADLYFKAADRGTKTNPK